MAIKNGSVAPERTQLIADVGTFYYGLSSHPKQGDYKRIAILVCEKFPELRDFNQASYWVSIQKQLSQFFRNLRRRTVNKAMHGQPHGHANESASKKIKLTAEDDEQAQKRNMELLKKAKPGAMAPKTFAKLFVDTFNERRKFIENQATSSTEVLEECPYLGHPNVVRKEVSRIIGQKNWEKEAEKKLETALKAVIQIKDKECEMRSEQVVEAVE
ncbi:uncharacterized protein LOC114544961 [Dendronephthya gigantea]|nr:uncharacterized protein LOC114544961 [Dendronephthya gigantea]